MTNDMEICKKCLEDLKRLAEKHKEDIVPPCMAYKNEPYHYHRLIETCPRVKSLIKTIFERDIDLIERLWREKLKA